jgi:hypothetical protein
LYDFYMMMKCRFLSLALLTTAAAGALFFGGCSTPESRISDHRDLYDSLPPRQQQLVAQGQIAGGMSRNAVWLAWGAPEQRVNGYARGNTTENWVYYTTTTYPYGYGYGYGYGGFGYGPYGYGYPGFWGGGVGVFRTHHGRRFAVFGDPFYDPFYYSYLPPTVSYPYKAVTFVNGRVVEFQHMVGPYR